MRDNEFEWNQFIKLGDMIGDGLHYEEPWISKEYKRLAKILIPPTEEDKPLYQPEITQSRADFQSGFNLAEELFKPKWISVETPPDDERNVIIKTFDYRRPKENVTDTTLGYFENGHWFYDSGGHVNDDNGWHIIQWMEIPQ